MYKSTCSLEAAIVIEAFGGVLMRKHIYGDIKDLVVVVVVVFCGSILTHLVTKNKEVVLKKGAKKNAGNEACYVKNRSWNTVEKQV